MSKYIFPVVELLFDLYTIMSYREGTWDWWVIFDMYFIKYEKIYDKVYQQLQGNNHWRICK